MLNGDYVVDAKCGRRQVPIPNTESVLPLMELDNIASWYLGAEPLPTTSSRLWKGCDHNINTPHLHQHSLE